MENERTEKVKFQCSCSSKKLLPRQSRLLDLPIAVTELILERLPLPDYIRFQKQHRIRHSPLSPPMAKSFPWLIKEGKNELFCYCASDQKYITLNILKSKYRRVTSFDKLGWFFLVKKVSPLSPDSAVLILDCKHLTAFLYRRNQWTLLDIPDELDSDVYFGVHSVYCNGKFFCIVDNFFVIDFGFATPIATELIMDCSQLPSEKYDTSQTLVESNGEVLLVIEIYDRSYRTVKVFKAEFSKMMWVKLKNIGDRALFVTSESSFYVLANDVGCKSNSVYFLDEEPSFVKARGIWTVFDIGTKLWSGGPPFPCIEAENKSPGCFEHWFLPSFDYNV